MKVRRGRPGQQRRRVAVRALAATVIVLLTGAGWLVLHRTRQAVLSYSGHRVQSPMSVLVRAEQQVDELVLQRHGARSDATRCYFQTAQDGSSRPLPVTAELACGPVRFLDGDGSHPYLTVPLRSSPGPSGRVVLSVAGGPSGAQVSGADAGRRLVRPDSLTPPAGDVALPAPPPPRASNDVLTRTSAVGGGLQQAGRDAVMIGRTSGVRLVSYGFVDRYGSGDDARSAPSGRRLLAFKVTPVGGESASVAPRLSVRVGTTVRGPLVVTADYVVTAVPTDVRSVELMLDDSGTAQSLSLLTGAPGAANPALASRINRSVRLDLARPVTVRVQGRKGAAGLTSGVISFGQVSLSYWAPNGSHPADPGNAFLHVLATVRLTGDPQPFGAEAALISVMLPGGRPITARNAAADPVHQVDDVVEVPVDVTSGTLRYSGTVTNSLGTVTVVTAVSVPFTIPAG
jgi:hypothetical protein